MANTRRMSRATTAETEMQYVKRRMAFLYRDYKYKYVMTDSGQLAYDAAIDDYNEQMYRMEQSGWQPKYKMLSKPFPGDFKQRIVTKVEYDYDDEKKRYIQQYRRNTRDGYGTVSSRSTLFKKHSTKEIRSHTRALISKIIKDDQPWDQQIYPDMHTTKHLIVSYW